MTRLWIAYVNLSLAITVPFNYFMQLYLWASAASAGNLFRWRERRILNCLNCARQNELKSNGAWMGVRLTILFTWALNSQPLASRIFSFSLQARGKIHMEGSRQKVKMKKWIWKLFAEGRKISGKFPDTFFFFFPKTFNRCVLLALDVLPHYSKVLEIIWICDERNALCMSGVWPQ